MSDQRILETTQLFHASQFICLGKFLPVTFVLNPQYTGALAGTTRD